MTSRPVIQTLDLQEQGDFPLVVFPPPEASERGLGPVGVDSALCTSQYLIGRRGPDIAVMHPVESRWAVYSSKILKMLSREDARKEMLVEAKDSVAFVKEMRAMSGEQDIADIMQHISEAAKQIKPDGSSTGQYL